MKLLINKYISNKINKDIIQKKLYLINIFHSELELFDSVSCYNK